MLQSGDGQVVLISGEPGIGKSRLPVELGQRLQAEPHLRLRYFCTPSHQDSALHPFIDQLGHAAGFARNDSPATPARNSPNPPPDNTAALDAGATQGSSEPANPACDVEACADFYHSFRQSDCTYQPYGGGPRQVCTKSGRQSAPSQPNLETVSSSNAMHGQCDFAACSQTYSSFNPSDCGSQPYGGGPRQLCEK